MEEAQAALATALSAEAEAAEWIETVAARVAAAKAAVAAAKAEHDAAKTAEAEAKAAARVARSARINAKEAVQAIENAAQSLVSAAQRWSQLNEPNVIALRPYLQWRSAGDSRTCSICALMDGLIWRADNAAFADVTPPRAFGCRCALVSLSHDDLVEEGGVVSTNVPAGFATEPEYGAEGIRRVLGKSAKF